MKKTMRYFLGNTPMGKRNDAHSVCLPLKSKVFVPPFIKQGRKELDLKGLPLRSMHSLVLSQGSDLHKLSSDIQELLRSRAAMCTGASSCANMGPFSGTVSEGPFPSTHS